MNEPANPDPNPNPDPVREHSSPQQPPALEQGSELKQSGNLESAADRNVRAPQNRSGSSALRIVLVIIGGTLLMLACGAWAVTGYFRLSSGTATLRDSVLAESHGEWSRKIALNIGIFTTGLARAGLSFVKMEPEARTALNAVTGVDVAIYTRGKGSGEMNCGAVLARADKKMGPRGWTRVVAVCEKREFVVVYMPSGKISPRNVTCCVLVVDGKEMVVASVRGNLEAIQSLVEAKIHEGLSRHRLFDED